MKNDGYIAFVLDDVSRARLLEAYPPKYPEVIAHHITLEFGVPRPPHEIIDGMRKVITTAQVAGYVDGKGIEVVVCSINGVWYRTDDSTWYHVTMSLDREAGRKPFHSNIVLRQQGWEHSQPITLTGRVEFIAH